MVVWESFVQYTTNELIPRFVKIIITPWLHKETLWMVIPLIIILFLIEAYFGRNKTEQLGWNTAFENTVSLFWIAVLLTKFLIENTPPAEIFLGRSLRSLILIAVLFTWTLLLLVSDYFHAIPRKIAFFISSEIPINTTAYIFIVLIVGEIPLDKTTVLASIVLFIFIIVFFVLFRAIILPSESARKILGKKRKIKLEQKRIKKQERKEKISMLKEKISDYLDFLKRREPKL